MALLTHCATTAYGDSIDGYSVYYNNRVIAEFNGHDLGRHKVVVIDTAEIKARDVIKVFYWQDTQCRDCKSFLSLYPERTHRFVYMSSKTGTEHPFLIKANNLLLYCRKAKLFELEVEYVEDGSPYSRELFNFRLQ